MRKIMHCTLGNLFDYVIPASPFQDGLAEYALDSLGLTMEEFGALRQRQVEYTVDALGRFDHESGPVFLPESGPRPPRRRGGGKEK
jgi:hypothetical protein